jgi:sugar phosphate isomerase/epimerase
MPAKVEFSVFTKPWKVPVDELGRLVARMGFTGVELPVRPGYQCEPENVTRDLPKVAAALREHGVRITSVAGPTDERTIAACGEVGVPIIRICPDARGGYLEAEARHRRHFDSLLPALERHKVRIGIQNHSGDSVPVNASGLRSLVEKYDPKLIGAVWDAGHNGLAGEPPEMGLDLVWSHLCMVNLKNACWQRSNWPEAPVAEWRAYWTTGRQGLSPWPRVAAELKRRSYSGVITLCAEYSDEAAVERLTTEDLAYARSLFA